jgi:NitT/TauT family transport system ATP-binding protein
VCISIRNLCFSFAEKSIFDNFNLEINDKNPVAVLGPSGCGKTTLLRLIAGLAQPASGSILISDNGICKTKTSFMFQEPRLLPYLTVLENTMLPVIKSIGVKTARKRASQFLRLASLSDKAGVFPANLSGGEMQRASMARAFTYDAPVLLLDEPFQSLDIPLRISLMDTLLKFLKEEHRYSVIVTHDPREALYLAKRIIVLKHNGAAVSIALDEQNESFALDTKQYVNSSAFHQEERLIAALSDS